MNVKRMKKVAVVFLTLLLACSFTVPALAAQKPGSEIVPLWDGIYSINLTLSFANGVGTATGVARKMAAAESISGVLTVYQQSGNDWIAIAEWSGSKRIGSLGMGGDFAVVQGATYKAVFTVTAYINGVAETETFEDIQTYI